MEAVGRRGIMIGVFLTLLSFVNLISAQLQNPGGPGVPAMGVHDAKPINVVTQISGQSKFGINQPAGMANNLPAGGGAAGNFKNIPGQQLGAGQGLNLGNVKNHGGFGAGKLPHANTGHAPGSAAFKLSETKECANDCNKFCNPKNYRNNFAIMDCLQSDVKVNHTCTLKMNKIVT